MIEELLTSLETHKENSFSYFDVSKDYEVTIMKIESNSKIPFHSHEENVYNYILQGKIELQNENEASKIYNQGQWIFINKNKNHSLQSLAETLILELWQKT